MHSPGQPARPGHAPAAQPALPHELRARPRLLSLTCRASACLQRPLRSACASHASARAPCAAVPLLPHALGAQRPARAPQRLLPCAPQLPSPLSQYNFCIVIQFFLLHPFPATIQNIVLQYNFMQPSHLQYKSCNTILVYTSLYHNTKYCIAIQIALNSLSLCNTKTVLQHNFFF